MTRSNLQIAPTPNSLVDQLLLPLMLFAILGSQSVAADTESQSAHERLIISAYDSPPSAWYLQDGSVAGNAPIWIEGFFAKIGEDFNLSYRLGTVKRITADLITGRADCALVSNTGNLGEYTVEIAHLPLVPVEIWSMRTDPINSPEEIREKRITTSYSYRKLVTPYAHHIHFVPTSGKMLYMLLSGRTDGIIGSSHIAKFRIHQLGVSPEKFHRVHFTDLRISFLCSKKSVFDKRFSSWKKHGNHYSHAHTVESLTVELQRRYDSDPRYHWVENSN